MTRHRRRHAQRLALPLAIPKPHDQASSYPSPSERLRIFARREQLIKALINLRVQGNLDEAQVNDLIAEYGPDEVIRVSLVLQTKFQHSGFLVDEPQIYRHYRLGFARFGGKRRLLSQPEQEELNFERAMMYAQREFKSLLPLKPSPRENELQELLIMDWHFWEDITPLDIPLRRRVPPPASYLPADPDLGLGSRPAELLRNQPIWSISSSTNRKGMGASCGALTCLACCTRSIPPVIWQIYILFPTIGFPTACPKFGRKWERLSKTFSGKLKNLKS
ncbi:hypothetical protein [Candidatus Villigracilis saccharophilus]|uniref:hypothetical protein n=1 Tax=Candidatus Villigracilis saccharophilus TaxID=3140684 RepID=UPI0031360763|nr:hypothetical protein [Anaerolineales bacterium]